MNILKRLFGTVEPVELDHIKPTRKPKDWRDKALAKALEKHGRQFHSHTKSERMIPPSRALLELDEKARTPARQESTAVSILKRRS